MLNDQRVELQNEVDLWRRRFDLGCRAWSVANQGALLVAACSSAATAVLLKTNLIALGTSRTDVAALLAALGSFITGISAFAGFDRKWRANRLGRGRMNQLRIDLMDPSADLSAVRVALKDALEAEDKEILGVAISTQSRG
jgi:hypothetical protein